MLCELSLLFNKKEGVEEQFPEVVGNSQYEKLWNHLDRRELRDFGSTKCFFALLHFLLLMGFLMSTVLPFTGQHP